MSARESSGTGQRGLVGVALIVAISFVLIALVAHAAFGLLLADKVILPHFIGVDRHSPRLHSRCHNKPPVVLHWWRCCCHCCCSTYLCCQKGAPPAYCLCKRAHLLRLNRSPPALLWGSCRSNKHNTLHIKGSNFNWSNLCLRSGRSVSYPRPKVQWERRSRKSSSSTPSSLCCRRSVLSREATTHIFELAKHTCDKQWKWNPWSPRSGKTDEDVDGT